ncbi:MAG: hypothetical protein LBT47_14300 [Deltaproteobacteria bacterium]|nr:hypothetical protein [Deltaproteobacteria bacterium]
MVGQSSAAEPKLGWTVLLKPGDTAVCLTDILAAQDVIPALVKELITAQHVSPTYAQ